MFSGPDHWGRWPCKAMRFRSYKLPWTTWGTRGKTWDSSKCKVCSSYQLWRKWMCSSDRRMNGCATTPNSSILITNLMHCSISIEASIFQRWVASRHIFIISHKTLMISYHSQSLRRRDWLSKFDKYAIESLAPNLDELIPDSDILKFFNVARSLLVLGRMKKGAKMWLTFW